MTNSEQRSYARADIAGSGDAVAGLWLLRSELPVDLRRKRSAPFPGVAESEAAETMATGKEP